MINNHFDNRRADVAICYVISHAVKTMTKLENNNTINKSTKYKQNLWFEFRLNILSSKIYII